MDRQQFIDDMRASLSGKSEQEIDARIEFYNEMVDDRIEEGFTEQEAIADIRSKDAIRSTSSAFNSKLRVIRDTKTVNRRLNAWQIVLVALGSPIWLSLIIVAFAAVFSIAASVWAVIISLWASLLAIAVSAVGCVLLAPILIFTESVFLGLASLGVGLVLAGISIFLFIGCKYSTVAVARVTKKSICEIIGLAFR